MLLVPEWLMSSSAGKLRWLVIIVGPPLLLLVGSVLALLFLPHPVPRNATPAQRLYLTYCGA